MTQELRITKQDIVNVLGKGNKAFVLKANQFAENLLADLDNLTRTKEVAFPSLQEYEKFSLLVNVLAETAADIRNLSKKSNFARAVFRSTARLLSGKKINPLNGKQTDIYNYFDEIDLCAFAEVLADSIKTPRFENRRKGPDSRFHREVTYIIAKHYKLHFGKPPGIGGGGKIEGQDSQFYLTPFQKVCDLIANEMKIRIGRPLQKEILNDLALENRTIPFFKPDVQSLPDKSEY